MPLEFPALTLPVLLNTGGSFASASSVTSRAHVFVFVEPRDVAFLVLHVNRAPSPP